MFNLLTLIFHTGTNPPSVVGISTDCNCSTGSTTVVGVISVVWYIISMVTIALLSVHLIRIKKQYKQ